MVCKWFIKQNPCEKILSATFPKILAKTKMSFTNLVSKVLFWKEVSENKVWMRKLYLSNEKWFEIIFKTSFIFKKKGEATLCLQNKNEFQNLLIWNLSKEKCFDLENKSFKKILFPKLAWISTCFSKVLQLTLPHHSNRISKKKEFSQLVSKLALQKFWVRKKMFSTDL